MNKKERAVVLGEQIEQARQQGAREERERVVGIIKNKWIGIVKNNADGAMFTAHEVCRMIHDLEEQVEKEGGEE